MAIADHDEEPPKLKEPKEEKTNPSFDVEGTPRCIVG